MKPAAFDYVRATSAADAVTALAEADGDGKVLAGGQSLVPLLNMRLAAPHTLVDVNRIADLAYVRVERAGVRVGALARHADVERDEAVYAALPLLRQAVRHVGHPTIRNRGTTVGSLVHADPAGEMTAVLALLDGEVDLRGPDGVRTVGAREFFVGPLESVARADELATSALFRRPPAGTGLCWLEVARRHGDYAVCGVGVLATLDADRRIVGVRAGFISVAPTPVVLDLTDAVVGAVFDRADWAAAGRLAAGALDPEEDIHATATYRRHLVAVLTARACAMAARRAVGAGA